MIAATTVTLPAADAWCIAITVAASMFTLGAAWGTVIDVGGSHTGVVGAAMNTSGQIGSVIRPLLVTWLQKRYDWNAPLLAIGSLYFMGAVAWVFINPNRKVFDGRLISRSSLPGDFRQARASRSNYSYTRAARRMSANTRQVGLLRSTSALIFA
jgi:hypothetical protein